MSYFDDNDCYYDIFFSLEMFPRVLSFATVLTVSVSASGMERPAFLKNVLDEAESARPVAFAAAAASAAAAAEPAEKEPRCCQFHKFSALPPELRERTLSFLGPLSAIKTLSVSHSWHQMGHHVIGEFLENSFSKAPEAYRTVLNMIGPMGPTEEKSKKVFRMVFFKGLLSQDPLFYLTPTNKSIIENFVSWGSLNFLREHVKNYDKGLYGYPVNFQRARVLNEDLADKGDREAIERCIDGLTYGWNDYPVDPPRARALNEALADKGDPEAIERRIEGYTNGWNGYAKDPEKALALSEAFADKGNAWAIQRRIMGYMNAWYGYAKDPEKALALYEALADKGNAWAIQRRIEGYTNGWHGYAKDPEKALALSEALADKGNAWAIQRRIEGYTNGWHGYPVDPLRAHVLNEAFADKGNAWAIQRRIEGLTHGLYGYPKNSHEAEKIRKILIARGNMDQILRKICSLLSSPMREAINALVRTFSQETSPVFSPCLLVPKAVFDSDDNQEVFDSDNNQEVFDSDDNQEAVNVLGEFLYTI